jgi:uncharacterized protein (TIGR02271 family)
MITTSNPEQLIGYEVAGSDGSKLGKVEDIYLDESTGKPEWASVKTGMFGSKTALVPLAVANEEQGRLLLPFDKEAVKSAPHHEPGQTLSPDDERQLFDHYGVPYGGETVTAQTDRAPQAGQARSSEGYDTSGPTTDDAMTRSEEQVRVGTQTAEVGRARLRKYVVTENVTQTVPVSHEEVRIEREPITDANIGRATDGPAISEEEHEVVLHEERPVVQKEVVPQERVRLATETVTEQAEINEQVRKEQIDTEGGEPGRQTR